MELNEIAGYLEKEARPYYIKKDKQEEKDGQGIHQNAVPDWRDSLYRSILRSLSTEELKQLTDDWERKGVTDTLYYKALGVLKYKERQRVSNISLAQILNWYTTGSGRVVEATKMLQERFAHESERNRRTIIAAFLGSGRQKSIDFAARYLRSVWIPSLSTLVAETWRTSRNTYLAEAIVKHAKVTYVMENKEDLMADTSYCTVCARLAGHKGFVIQESLLSTPELLYVYAKSGVRVDPAVIEARVEEYLGGKGYVSVDEISFVLWCLGERKCTNLLLGLKVPIQNRLRRSAKAVGLIPMTNNKDH